MEMCGAFVVLHFYEEAAEGALIESGGDVVPVLSTEGFDDGFEIIEGGHLGHQVDDGFGRETGYGGAADVLDVMNANGG